MKRFFSRLLGGIDLIRRITLNAIFVLFVLILVAGIFAARPQLPRDAALIVDPSGEIVEEAKLPSPLDLELEMGKPQQTRLHELTTAIRTAAGDPRIRLMVLKLADMQPAGLPALEEIRHAIAEFRNTGKLVIAVGPNYSQSQYYLAAGADQIFLDPLGGVGLHGFGIYRNYYREALEKLKIDIQLFRAGRYKAAAEPLIRDDMSKPDREANLALLLTEWDTYKRDLAEMRHIKADRIQTVLDQPARHLAAHNGSPAELALAEGLVDTLAWPGEVEQYIAGAMGAEAGGYARIDFRHYLKKAKPAPNAGGIGIITASGMMLDGAQPPGFTGSDTMIQMLQQARKNPAIKAVVLRIDSPGGSAQAAAAIRSEILRLKQSGKPVIASMANYAASGGYWIASPADEIWAAPTTITGSIGAFGVLPNFERALASIGVHTDGLGTTVIAGGLRPDRKMPDELRQVIEQSIGHVYNRFVDSVATDRGMDRAHLETLAGGRVWSGLDAQKQGLVDHLGSFDDAVMAAAKRAGLEQYGTVWITPPMSFQQQLFARIFGDADSMLAQAAAGLGLPLPKLWRHQASELSQMLAAQNPLFTISDIRLAQ